LGPHGTRSALSCSRSSCCPVAQLYPNSFAHTSLFTYNDNSLYHDYASGSLRQLDYYYLMIRCHKSSQQTPEFVPKTSYSTSQTCLRIIHSSDLSKYSSRIRLEFPTHAPDLGHVPWNAPHGMSHQTIWGRLWDVPRSTSIHISFAAQWQWQFLFFFPGTKAFFFSGTKALRFAFITSTGRLEQQETSLFIRSLKRPGKATSGAQHTHGHLGHALHDAIIRGHEAMGWPSCNLRVASYILL
jgi:hypothetical protein